MSKDECDFVRNLAAYPATWKPAQQPNCPPDHRVAFANVMVTQHEYQILSSRHLWLNDEIINAYSSMLQIALNKLGEGVVLCMTTNFLNCLANGMRIGLHVRKRLARALQSEPMLPDKLRPSPAERKALQSLTKMFIPINVNENHWVAIVLVFNSSDNSCTINFADSLFYNTSDMPVRPVEAWIRNEMNLPEDKRVLPVTHTTFVHVTDR